MHHIVTLPDTAVTYMWMAFFIEQMPLKLWAKEKAPFCRIIKEMLYALLC